MALWTPADETTALWLDNSDQNTLFDATTGGSLVAPGGAIARMEDKSGNARHFTQSTLANRSTWQTNQQNGLAVGRFDGGNDRFLGVTESRNIARAKPAIYVVAVVNPDTYVSNDAIFSIRTTTTTSRLLMTVESSSWRLGGRRLDSNTYAEIQFSTAGYDSWNLIGGLLDFSVGTSEAIRLFVNGSQVANSTLPGTSTLSSDSLSEGVTLGSFVTSNYFDGDIGEIIVLDYLPTLGLIQTFDGYLAHRWGIQSKLNASHPYRFSPPGAGAIDSRRRRFALGGYGL